MSYLNALLSDLRDRKLWPVAVLLLAAIVAVPVVLSKSPAPAPVPSGTAIGTPVAEAHTGAAITVEDAAVQAPLGGSGRDPFTQQKLPSAKTTSTAGSGATTTAATTGATTGSTGSSGSSGSGSSGVTVGYGTGSSTVAPVLPVNPTTPSGSTGTTPARATGPGLKSDEVYDVSISTTDPAGNMTSVTALTRESVLPDAHAAQLVELGVLQGGKEVLFAELPGATVSGPASCTPGPLDCEVIGLRVGQTETISIPGSTATAKYMFEVTGITATKLASAAAADSARRQFVRAGQTLLDQHPISAVSLFLYQPSLGALVDQRNLTVGGN